MSEAVLYSDNDPFLKFISGASTESTPFKLIDFTHLQYSIHHRYMYKRYIKNTAWASSAPVPPSLTSFGHVYIAMAETNCLPRSASKQNLNGM